MSEVTGRLTITLNSMQPWLLESDDWNGRPCRTNEGEDARVPDGRGVWWFARRIDAIAFAKRKGIKLEAE